MDLTIEKPRSAKDRLIGLVSLKRVIDKAKASNEGHLGEYDYDCPHDKPLFEFLGTTGPEFASKVKELQSDDAIADWVRTTVPLKEEPGTRSNGSTTTGCTGIPIPVHTPRSTSITCASRLRPGAKTSSRGSTYSIWTKAVPSPSPRA